MDRQTEPNERERVLAFDAATGRRLWTHTYPAAYGDLSYGNGPRSTPTFHQGRLYTVGAVGHVHCLDARTGRPAWSTNLIHDHGGRLPIWGYACSPVIFEDLVIVHAGAQPGGGVLALDRRTGREAWRSLDDKAGYATPILIDRGGRPELVCWTPEGIRGLDPHSGDVRWRVPFEVTYGTSIATPIFRDGIVLVSGYWEGSKAIRFSEAGAAEVTWEDRRNLRGLMSQPLYRDGYGYLLDKRHGLTCFELASGRKLWDDENRMTPKGRNPQASVVWLGDTNRILSLNSDGDLILARLSPQGYREDSRTNLLERTWAHPAYSGTRVYARNDTELVCYSLVED